MSKVVDLGAEIIKRNAKETNRHVKEAIFQSSDEGNSSIIRILEILCDKAKGGKK